MIMDTIDNRCPPPLQHDPLQTTRCKPHRTRFEIITSFCSFAIVAILSSRTTVVAAFAPHNSITGTTKLQKTRTPSMTTTTRRSIDSSSFSSLSCNLGNLPNNNIGGRMKSRQRARTIMALSSSSTKTTNVNNDGKKKKDDNDDKITSSSSDKKSNAETFAFNNKLNELSRNYKKGTAQKVQDVLMEMIRRVETGQEQQVKPNVVSWTAAINAWARSPDPEAAQKAEVLFQQMCTHITPNSYAFNAIITAWVRSRDRESTKKAEQKLTQMWTLFEQSNYTNSDLQPDAQAYNRVINAIARSREPDCARKATVLLGKMEELCTVGGYTDMEPCAKTFGAIINAHANSGDIDASDKAAELLQRMESLYQLGYHKVKPNTFVYNACMNAFAKSVESSSTGTRTKRSGSTTTRTDGEVKAEQILNLMEKMYKENGDESVKPDVISYSTMINAIANSGCHGAGERAENILQRMTHLYLATGDEKVKPNAITMTAVIKAWSSSWSLLSSGTAGSTTSVNDENNNDKINYEMSGVKLAAQKSQELLERMCMLYLAGDQSMKPTKVTFDLVFEAFKTLKDQESMDWVNAVRQNISTMDNKHSRKPNQHQPRRRQQQSSHKFSS